MKAAVFNDSSNPLFNYALSYNSANTRFAQVPAEIIPMGYAMWVFKPIVDSLPEELKKTYM